MSLVLLWLQFGAIAVAILIAAQFMARSADVVAEKTGLGRSFVGVVMLAQPLRFRTGYGYQLHCLCRLA